MLSALENHRWFNLLNSKSTSHEVPLPSSLFSIQTLRTMFISVGGRVEETLTTSQSSLAQEMAAIRACQEQMFATQTQHTAILRQIQHHLGIISPVEHSIPIPPEPSHAPPFVHQTMPPEEPTIGEAEAAEPSSSHHPLATI
ncbi:hypothetical protein CK203_037201 [Vitis vinifera]|uniref:Uncharacterized protein n=1 Tax=Vitis vinifera TaxID=29760 RepID=A0A438HS55_VITVI|nr:hypothetical protein CK203_037201 [Vitis vinifera]